MSDNIRKIYQAYARTITPDEATQERLTQKLQTESRQKDNKRTGQRKKQLWGIRLAVVACALLLVSGWYLKDSMEASVQRQTGWLERMQVSTRNISRRNPMSYDDRVLIPDKEKMWMLEQLISQETVQVVCENSNSNSQIVLDKAEQSRLYEAMKQGKVQPDLTMERLLIEKQVDYQVVQGGNTIISFTIYDDTYLQIENETTIYKIKE